MSYTFAGWMWEPTRLFLLRQTERVRWAHKFGEKSDYWAYVDGPRMFIKICPGGKVHKHADRGIKTHLVIQSDGAVSWIDGQPYTLEQGGIYIMDASKEHESENPGSVDRIHLVLS